MAAVALSYAQALRVIGQKLVSVRGSSFELAKWNDDYIIWIRHEGSAQNGSVKNPLMKKITETIFGHSGVDKKPPHRMYFTQQDIWAADMELQSKRNINSPSDARDFSFVLRVVGDYLDRNQAKEFTIFCSPDSVTVRYDEKTELLSTQNLYDFGIAMYLRRSGRHPMG